MTNNAFEQGKHPVEGAGKLLEDKWRRTVAQVGNSAFAKRKDEMNGLGFTDKELETLIEQGLMEFDENVTKTYSPTEKFFTQT